MTKRAGADSPPRHAVSTPLPFLPLSPLSFRSVVDMSRGVALNDGKGEEGRKRERERGGKRSEREARQRTAHNLRFFLHSLPLCAFSRTAPSLRRSPLLVSGVLGQERPEVDDGDHLLRCVGHRGG